MDMIFIKLNCTLFISNYIVFAFLNLNMLVIGYTFLEYLQYIIFNIWFILFLLSLYPLLKKR